MNEQENPESLDQTTEDIEKNTKVKKQKENKNSFFIAIAAFFDRLNYSMFRNYVSIFNNKYVSRVKNLELAIKVLLVVLVFFMFLTVFLVNAVSSAAMNKNITVMVPSNITSGGYSVTKYAASGPYFELVAKGFVTTVANYNYMNAEKKINAILPSILPYTYSATFDEIKKNIQFIVNEKVNQKFIIQKTETFLKGSRAKVVFTGLLTRTVGSIKVIDNKPYKIPIIIKIDDYTPYIESFDFDYIGISKAKKDKDIALKRDEEIAMEKEKEKLRKKNRQSNYEKRQMMKKKEKDF